MNKDELERELRLLLAYAQSERPSRSYLAGELRSVMDRVAGGDPVADLLARIANVLNG